MCVCACVECVSLRMHVYVCVCVCEGGGLAVTWSRAILGIRDMWRERKIESQGGSL